jgi:hypothetical protein
MPHSLRKFPENSRPEVKQECSFVCGMGMYDLMNEVDIRMLFGVIVPVGWYLVHDGQDFCIGEDEPPDLMEDNDLLPDYD